MDRMGHLEPGRFYTIGEDRIFKTDEEGIPIHLLTGEKGSTEPAYTLIEDPIRCAERMDSIAGNYSKLAKMLREE